MGKNLADYRRSYEHGELDETSVLESPFKQFEKWFDELETEGCVDEPNAMTVSTVDADGSPRSRVVLMKHFSEDGFIFFTNYHSAKGKAIAKNPNVCISFYWPPLERQVIVKGIVEKIDSQKSRDYFKIRPKKSQLGAVVSNQSQVVDSREQLEKAMKSLESKYADKDVPMPENWGGYLVRPKTFEFWQGRRSRLHDRVQYVLQEESKDWKIQRLAP